MPPNAPVNHEQIGDDALKPQGELRRGWSTGACACASANMALQSLILQQPIHQTTITLPHNRTALFQADSLKFSTHDGTAWVRKDAGDDPDVTHQALIWARITPADKGMGIIFHAGAGVGIVTRAGLPINIGEPAITPAPRAYISANISAIAQKYGYTNDWHITIGIENGSEIAKKTWNARLGIIGGLSILGTTGIVIPYSCSAWIHAIVRGIDVARAAGFKLVGAATGKSSDQYLQSHYGLDSMAIIDMGDFVGGMLKYIKKNPLPRLVIAGGVGKMTKLAQGAFDLHSARSQVNFAQIAQWLNDESIANFQSVAQILETRHRDLFMQIVTERATQQAQAFCGANTPITIDLLVR